MSASLRPSWGLACTLACLALLNLPISVEAQFGRRQAQVAPERGRAIQVGARAGLDIRFEDPVFGAHLRIPVDPGARIELYPGALVTFVSGGQDIQFDADVAIVPDRAGVFFLGGGAAFRDSDDGSETDAGFESGFNLFAGATTPREPGDRSLKVQLEFRYTDVANIDHSILTLAFNYPLVFF